MKAAIKSDVLERIGVRHGFSTCVAGSLDELELSCARLGIARDRLVLLRQVHGADVVVACKEDLERFRAERPVADAAVTAEDRITVGVRTADCLPVLLASGDGTVVAAAHAGWRGVLAGVVPAAVERMASLGAEPRRLVAALGPSIRPCCYQVGRDVFEPFRDKFGPSAVSLVGGDMRVDLQAAVVQQLVECGVAIENIDAIDLCTCCRPEMFFSYRREGRLAGRQLAFIGRKSRSRS